MTTPLLESALAFPRGGGSDTLVADASRTPGQGTTTGAVAVTCAAGTLLLAAVTWDSSVSTTLTAAVAGGSLAWTVNVQANTTSGTVGGGAAILTAYAAGALSAQTITATVTSALATSLTIVTFTGADPVQNGGTAVTDTSSAGLFANTYTSRRHLSWAWSAAYNWDGATLGTPGTGQARVVSYTDNAGDAGWVQQQNAATVGAGVAVTSNTTAPSTHGHMATLEVLPALVPEPPMPTPARLWQPVARSYYL